MGSSTFPNGLMSFQNWSNWIYDGTRSSDSIARTCSQLAAAGFYFRNMDGHDCCRWHDIGYLQQGSKAQRRAYRILKDRQILEHLEPYNAVLAGTFPLDLVVAGSDLDILCEVTFHPGFAAHVERCFGKEDGFQVENTARGGSQVTIVNFVVDSLPFQLYGDPTPVVEQAAYLHMDVEHRLLQLGGRKARERILELKKAGIKTEPAFAAWLGLDGDPYAELLELATLCDQELVTWYRRRVGNGC
jgi:hypothetical protein